MDILCLGVKICIIIVLIIIFINLYNQSRIDNFTDSNTNPASIDYIKLNETYIEPDGTNLKMLYANYYGQETEPGKDNKNWTDKTLEQCSDLCNQLEGCAGFSRKANVSDTAKDICFPRSNIGICHSARKGDDIQMQNAIKYNSYIKNNNTHNKNILTKCIGDTNMTLKRAVFIKSHMYPNKFIGTIDNSLVLLIDKASPNFENQCKFRVEMGLDGIGTVSFFHIDSNKYLARIPPTSNTTTNTTDHEFMGLIEISSSTEEKKRASFNILDAIKNKMRFKCMRVNGENKDKFISINPDNDSYLICSEEYDNIELATFDILDNIISSKIINTISNIDTKKIDNFQSIPEVDIIGNKLIVSQTSNNLNTENLDTTENIKLYDNIFNPKSKNEIGDYLNDNYGQKFSKTTVINKKINDIMLQQQLSNTLNKNKDTYDLLKQLNREIEKEINGLNMGLNAKNDKINNILGRMQLSDMANDYYKLKNVYNKTINS
jgi:hypothetical protein